MGAQELWEKTKRVRLMSAEGFGLAEIAEQTGLSEDLVRRALATFRLVNTNAEIDAALEETESAVAAMFGRPSKDE